MLILIVGKGFWTVWRWWCATENGTLGPDNRWDDDREDNHGGKIKEDWIEKIRSEITAVRYEVLKLGYREKTLYVTFNQKRRS